MTLLSVVIPTFQRANLACETIKGYLDVIEKCTSRNSMDWECIIIDDGSTDGTFEQLQGTLGNSPRCRLLKLQLNGGPGVARNAGTAVARGNWIWFLDDDDQLDEGNFPKLIEILKKIPAHVDLVSHSLKFNYSVPQGTATRLMASKMLAFQEYQEVFRHVIRRSLLINNNIKFSSGFHEDIRYLVEVLWRSRAIQVFNRPLVNKRRTPNAITTKMSINRIDGYVKAYNELSILLRKTEWGDRQQLTHFLVQTLGVILLLITRERDDSISISLLNYLQDSRVSHNSPWSEDIINLPEFGSLATNFEWAGTVWRKAAETQTPDQDLLTALRDVFASRLSCKDLDSSLFLGPDEIRACCKRFFVNGIRKGDVVLLKADPEINLTRIKAAKQELIDRINSNNAPECSGCPYIERRKQSLGGIDYLSLENFAFCNMRCTYCSPKYYGGTEAIYDASAIVTEVANDSPGFETECHVVWGGGEPTLSPKFESINNSLQKMPQSGKIRVLSNGLKYSTNLESNLKDPRFHLVTSVDAGTEATFKLVRGKEGFTEVLGNLLRYQRVLDDPRRLTIKYIISPNNFESFELQGFAEAVAESPLLRSLFQISCDFTLNAPEGNLVYALYELAARLYNVGAQFVFFDDLVRDRVKIDKGISEKVCRHLEAQELNIQQVWRADTVPSLILWGSGKQAQWLINHTTVGKSGRILGTVADKAGYAELSCRYSSSGLQPAIFPSGVQSTYEILCKIEESGLAGEILRGVLL